MAKFEIQLNAEEINRRLLEVNTKHGASYFDPATNTMLYFASKEDKEEWKSSGDKGLIVDEASITRGNLTGYVALDSITELPAEASTLGFLVGTRLYVYVGEGGDTNDGTYKDCGEFRGPQGPQGVQGEAGPQGPAYNDSEFKQQFSELAERVNDIAKGKTYIDGDTLTFRNWADAKIEGETLKL